MAESEDEKDSLCPVCHLFKRLHGQYTRNSKNTFKDKTIHW